MPYTLQPTALDIDILILLAPLERNEKIVDTIGTLTSNSLFNGVAFAVPLFLLWHRADPSERISAQRLLVTTLLATLLGAALSLILQQVCVWPPPGVAPETADIFSPAFQSNGNRNSFPSDSTMLYSTVAFGVSSWRPIIGSMLLMWLLVFVAPCRLFVGGHYPSDIGAGLILGLISYLFCRWATRKISLIDRIAASSSPVVLAVLFVWIFEVGHGFADVRSVVNLAWHLHRHF